ncbi:hypothetical protein BaRGS_00008430 [Batillaria attramentaria]|uniref:Uncharacterized protein n=1 Tax=Batillaria attramentaria TaxID=370345 RepID=A0ABD0LKZ6_9CAEN
MTTTTIRARLRPLIPFLRANSRQRQRMLRDNPVVVDRLCEIVWNVLKGKVPLSPGQKRRWGRRKQSLRRLVSPNISATQRVQLIQTGGFLPFIVPLALKLLSGL